MFFSLPLRILLIGALLASTVAAAEQKSKAEERWLEIRSPHFSILTDAGEKRGREVALRFEQMRAVFGDLLMRTRLNLPVPVYIIALKSDKEYAQVAPVRQGQPVAAAGFFLPGEDRCFIVLDLFEDEPWRAVTHDFAHLLLSYNYPPAQGWFDEGFAEYFASIRVDNKQVGIGGDPELSPAWKQDVMGNTTEVRNLPRSLTDLLSSPVWLAMPDLFTMRHDTAGSQEGTHHTLFHAQSWMVMHYLLNRKKLAETGAYFDLVLNQKVPSEEAIQKAYGMTAAQFEQAVKDYFRSLTPLFRAQDAAQQPGTSDVVPQVYQFPVPLGPDDVAVVTKPAHEADAKVMLAEVLLRLPEHREQGLKELQNIAAQPPANAAAHRALAWAHLQKNEFDQAAEELGAALEMDPRDPWTRYYLALGKYRAARASGQPIQGLSNMMQDLRAVLDWYPEFAEAYNMLGVARLEGGGTASALEALRAAIQLSPRNQQYLLNLAEVYAAGKKWDEARALLERLKSSGNPQVAAAARRRLDDLQVVQKYGIPPQRPPEAPMPAASEEEEPERKPAEPAPDTRKVQFLKGKLVSVDCAQAPAAVLTVLAGGKTLKLRTADSKSLLLIGADEFSCAWKNRPVAVNYRAGGKADGDLVSVEVQ